MQQYHGHSWKSVCSSNWLGAVKGISRHSHQHCSHDSNSRPGLDKSVLCGDSWDHLNIQEVGCPHPFLVEADCIMSLRLSQAMLCVADRSTLRKATGMPETFSLRVPCLTFRFKLACKNHRRWWGSACSTGPCTAWSIMFRTERQRDKLGANNRKRGALLLSHRLACWSLQHCLPWKLCDMIPSGFNRCLSRKENDAQSIASSFVPSCPRLSAAVPNCENRFQSFRN